MNRKLFLGVFIITFFFDTLIFKTLYSQYQLNITNLTIAMTDVSYGLPFKNLTPIHPGAEVGATFFKRSKINSTKAFDTVIGFYHHSIISNAIYLNCLYTYQYKATNSFGINFSTGIGLLYSVYPGAGYTINKKTKLCESVVSDRLFTSLNMGFGISFIKPKKIHPFINYYFSYLNPWELSTNLRSTANLKFGIQIQI